MTVALVAGYAFGECDMRVDELQDSTRVSVGRPAAVHDTSPCEACFSLALALEIQAYYELMPLLSFAVAGMLILYDRPLVAWCPFCFYSFHQAVEFLQIRFDPRRQEETPRSGGE